MNCKNYVRLAAAWGGERGGGGSAKQASEAKPDEETQIDLQDELSRMTALATPDLSSLRHLAHHRSSCSAHTHGSLLDYRGILFLFRGSLPREVGLGVALGGPLTGSKLKTGLLGFADGSAGWGECGIGSRDHGAAGEARSRGGEGRACIGRGAAQPGTEGHVEDESGGKGTPVRVGPTSIRGGDPGLGSRRGGVDFEGTESSVEIVQSGDRLVGKVRMNAVLVDSCLSSEEDLDSPLLVLKDGGGFRFKTKERPRARNFYQVKVVRRHGLVGSMVSEVSAVEDEDA